MRFEPQTARSRPPTRFRVYGLGFRVPKMENQMEKSMETEMETGFIYCIVIPGTYFWPLQ